MKKPSKPITLALRAETIARLENHALADVPGGRPPSNTGVCTSRPAYPSVTGLAC